MLKFEVGDWIICDRAEVPKYLEILAIDFEKKRYVMDYDKYGNIQGCVSFENENDWHANLSAEELVVRKIKKEIGLC